MPLSHCRILIVDEDEQIRRALELLLARFNAKVRLAASLRDGLEAIAWNPNCVVVNAELPDGDGSVLLRELRRRDSPAKVAVTSAEGDPRDLEAGRRLGADKFFLKPVEWSRMLEWIRGACPPPPN